MTDRRTLSLAPNFADPDAAFRALVEAHRGLSPQNSRQLDARLILLLANHVGDLEILREAIALARATLPTDAGEAG
jgi:hypothetical protein